MSQNIYATCVSIKRKGVLFLGKSGSGKSDIALRLIASQQAKLVADDRVDVLRQNNRLKATAPKKIKNLLEVRHIGIIELKAVSSVFINLVVELTNEPLERMPENLFYEIEGIKIPLIRLNSFENSAPAKVLAALRLL